MDGVEPDPGGKPNAWAIHSPDSEEPFFFFGIDGVEPFWRILVMGAFIAGRRAR